MLNRRWGHGVLVLLSMLAGCSLPAPLPLDSDGVLTAVLDREERSSELVVEALRLHERTPLGLDLPSDASQLADPRTDRFWYAHALAFDPEVRAARREWRAVREEEQAAGLPDPLGASYGLEDVTRPDAQSEVKATLDLLSLLGLGRKNVDREFAASSSAASLARLEESAWRAVFAVDRARIRAEAARERVRLLREVLEQAERDQRRLDLLQERGRIGAGIHGRTRAVLANLKGEVTRLQTEEVRATEVLALAAGLSPRAVSLFAAYLPARSERPVAETPSGLELLDRVPSLRASRLAYAVAEARVRQVAAAAWPKIGIGPGFRIRPDALITGGMVSVDFPWPGSVEPRVRAAVERREGARERVEDLLVQTQTRAETRRREWQLAIEQRDRDVRDQLEGSARAWSAIRARLAISDDPDVIETFLDAMQLRSRGVLSAVDADERVALQSLAFDEFAGIAPDGERGSHP